MIAHECAARLMPSPRRVNEASQSEEACDFMKNNLFTVRQIVARRRLRAQVAAADAAAASWWKCHELRNAI